jgi:hypothetical protein
MSSLQPAVTDRLQRMVDSLAQRLSLAVLIDDADLRPIAYSPQLADEVDRVRASSILERGASSEVASYMDGQKISQAEGAVRIPSSEELGLKARVCTPISIGSGRPLGYLWAIENGRSIGDGEIELIEQMADAAAPLMKADSRRHLDQQVRARIDELLSGNPRLSCDAAADLLDAQAFSGRAKAAVLVSQVIAPAGEQIDETVTMLLSRGLHAFSRGLPPRMHLGLTRDDHAIAVVGDECADQLERRLPAMGEALLARIAEAIPGPGWRVSVGVGSVASSLAGTPRSYSQAVQAAGVAGRLENMDTVLKWSDMGIYRLLAPAADGELEIDTLPPGILTLLEHPGGDMLLHTLETYLDHGGDAQATTAELFLARGSLYYRLHRIEDIAGVSLRSGHDRLMLHVGIKLARIHGLYPSADADAGIASVSELSGADQAPAAAEVATAASA